MEKAAGIIGLGLLMFIPIHDAKAGQTDLEASIAGSQDFRVHREAFLAASERLVASGRCKLEDFQNMAGWAKSEKGANIYFVYCGGFSKNNRIYTDVSNGRIFQ